MNTDFTAYLKTPEGGGFTDAEIENYKSFLGDAKFVKAGTAILAARDQAIAERNTAQTERETFETNYTTNFIPQLQQVTKDAIEVKGENARLKAQLEAARGYGVLPEETATVTPPAETRAPGSPNPDSVSREDFKNLQSNTAKYVAAMNDLNAENQSLFGKPISDMQGLIAKAEKESALGRPVNLKQLWETEYKVSDRRAEIAAESKAKETADLRKSIEQEYAQKYATNPNLRAPQTSRFAQIPAEMPNATEPWKRPSTMVHASNAPWRDSAVKKLVAAGFNN